MTMPSLECQVPYSQQPMKSMVLERLSQRVGNLQRHSQRCQDRYAHSQQTIRANEKLETAKLRQKLQEAKTKKGSKCKMDTSRNKVPPMANGIDGDHGFGIPRVPMKRSMADCNGTGYPDASHHDPKRMKSDVPNMNNLNSSQGPDCTRVSVQINLTNGGAPRDQIETTVNFGGNVADSQSVSVNVKKETNDARRAQQQHPPPNPMNQRQNMHFPHPQNREAPDAGSYDVGGQEDYLDDIMEIFDQLSAPETMPPEPVITPDPMIPASRSYQPQQQRQYYPNTQQMPSPLHHPMPSPHRITPPNMTQQPPTMTQQHDPNLICKTEKIDHATGSWVDGGRMHGFRGSAPESKQEPPGMQRQNSMGRGNVPNIQASSNIRAQQSIQVGGNNFVTSISSQQNISMNMMQQQPQNYPPTMTRQTPSNQNMTSHHIRRLSQVGPFTAHDPEPPRLFHPPQVPANPYGSSAQLRQIAERSQSRTMNPDPRTTQTLPHHCGEVPSMSQPMLNHQMQSGSQRLSHMDTSMYSRSQFVQNQRSNMNVMMQQSMHQESLMMRQYPMQQNQPPSYSRVPEPHPQQLVPANPPNYAVNGPTQWNSRGVWPQSTSSHNPLHHHRPQITHDHMQRPHMNSDPSSVYIPELDNQDLSLIDEFLNEGVA